MKVELVAKMPATQRFLYWIRERHAIYTRRQAGQKKPWTDDVVLRSWFFTNPYRENDKTTIWFKKNIRDPLDNTPSLLFATICFRWFNYIPTGKNLIQSGLLTDWNRARAVRELESISSQGKPVFTGAFMIPAPPGSKKIEHVCNQLENIWQDRESLLAEIRGRYGALPTLRYAHTRLTRYPWVGDFAAYEIVTDLRHTYLLRDAIDILTWANPGPGCMRGLYRLAGLPKLAKGNADHLKRLDDWEERMANLLNLASKQLSDLPPLEMREIEHSLCEFDKYDRAMRLMGYLPATGTEGKMKRRYDGI